MGAIGFQRVSKNITTKNFETQRRATKCRGRAICLPKVMPW